MTDNRYAGGVAISTSYYVYNHLPVFAFLLYEINYAHPAAQHTRRAKYLFQLNTTADPVLFTLGLMNNPWEQIDYVFSDRPDHRILVRYFEGLNTVDTYLDFWPERLAAPWVQQRTCADSTYWLHAFDYDRNPLRDLPDAAANQTVDQAVLATALRLLLDDFPYEVDEPVLTVKLRSKAPRTGACTQSLRNLMEAKQLQTQYAQLYAALLATEPL